MKTLLSVRQGTRTEYCTGHSPRLIRRGFSKKPTLHYTLLFAELDAGASSPQAFCFFEEASFPVSLTM
ncbi:hypothetical protein QUA30_07575 [Microcoleus sp. Pol14C2]|uniref:hypothetical protein n=1 Tax=unclassified Microcoleus TaxID=2642155 RepID=UPI002FD000DE